MSVDVSNLNGKIPFLGGFKAGHFYAGLLDGTSRLVDRAKFSDQVLNMVFNPSDGNILPADWLTEEQKEMHAREKANKGKK